ncbi:hypothetical protein SEA_LILBEANIE_25 [Gordonia phage Lilbeanie]|uniref:Uncharacterized protein n=1 Tax=Gordonia phage Lilbeanie TaxID=2794947 RepID=A0A7T1KSC4_9CAUD|nr:hypothetical protein J1773_gp25 [Gordonia phage Lilbeanie]QPO17103.1 hypothetical protein SEA_LILBEANIE_25 [Gordonia phage Lilbeanie]
MADVTIYDGTIDATLTARGEVWGRKVGRRVVNAAKRRTPVDTGALRNSLEYLVTPIHDGVEVTIGTPLFYGEFFHTGTGIYGPTGQPIRPVTRTRLKFQVKGRGGARWVYAKEVRGIERNPFLIDALIEVMGAVERLR